MARSQCDVAIAPDAGTSSYMDRLARRLRRVVRPGRTEPSLSVRFRRVVALVLVTLAIPCAIALGDVLFLEEGLAVSGTPADAPGATAPRAIGTVLQGAEAQTRRTPADPTPWLTMAWAETAASGRLSPAANAALERSYDLAPYGPEVTMWRLAFVIDHWSTAGSAVRASALRELAAVYPQKGWEIEALAKTGRDPTGRMVAVMASRRLRSIERLKAERSLRRP